MDKWIKDFFFFFFQITIFLSLELHLEFCSAPFITSQILQRSDAHILSVQDLEMGSVDGGGSKLHPAVRISGRRSGGQLVPKGLWLVGRNDLTSPTENF